MTKPYQFTSDCPNCISPWKCNGPHLEKAYENIYRSKDGYYMLSKTTNKWVFVAHEGEYTEQNLLDIANTLSILSKECHKV